MTNHVHVLIVDCPDDGEGVKRILKGNSQAELSRAAGNPQRCWTAGGSNRYLHGHPAIGNVDCYIRDQEHILAEIVNLELVRK